MPSPRRRPEVLLYTAPDCGLCRTAREELYLIAEREQCVIREVNIRPDPALERDYGDRIPVVLVDGVEVSAGPIARPAVRAAIRSAARGEPVVRSPIDRTRAHS